MQYVWISDTHFESENDILSLTKKLNNVHNIEGIFLTGDISISKTLVYHLSILERELQKPIYFVAGNHDFWYSNFESVRTELTSVDKLSTYLKYMSIRSYSHLDQTTTIIGHDGWYSATAGNPKQNRFILNDWSLIKEYVQNGSHQNMNGVINISQNEAKKSAEHIHNSIKAATRYSNKIVVLTHVPPFSEACRYQGSQTEHEALPWYTNEYLGIVLKDAANAFKNINFIVLCGHTHNKYVTKLSNNLHCYVMNSSSVDNASAYEIIAI